MLKKSADSFKYVNYNEQNIINVWADNKKREEIIRRKLLTDKNFKLTSLQVNPVYKPIFDKLDAYATKELQALDKSVLWSRKFTPRDFKTSFVYPAIIFAIGIFCIFNYGVKTRMYMQYVKHGRRLGLEDKMNIDLDNIHEYPRSV